MAAAVAARRVSAEEIVVHHLARIADHSALNAFVTVDGDRAVAGARALDARLDARPSAGALLGVPFAAKDIFDTAGLRTTYGSGLFAKHVPRRTAPVVQRILDSGAVLVGKANLNEFAGGVTSRNPFFGDCGNPRREGFTPCGSSGGNAASLAAGLCTIGLATDGGGSIRTPAAACGVAGFKPSYGTLPLEGSFPLAAPFDHAGPMARTIDDCALLMVVLTGMPTPTARLQGLRVGMTHPIAAVHDLVASGALVEEVEMPDFHHLLPFHLAEFAYSHRELYPAQADGYTPECRTMLDAGRQVPAVEYLQLRDDLESWRRRCEEILTFVILVSPAISREPPRVDEPESLEMLFEISRLTRPFNLLGWPSAVTRDGTMFAGRSDARVLGAALAWEETLPPVEVAGSFR
jgi:aspartyl-tRNA(Asn)/glutamyl-tRNA(Gln) amidotransferase subunit A